MSENVIALNESVNVPSKAEISTAAKSFVERVNEGYMNPLLAYGQITALEQMLKEAKESIKEAAMNEAERYESNTFDALGMNVQIKETGVKYDYSDNARWLELKEQVDLANAELKSHELLLKEMKQFTKTSTTSLSVTLRKQ